MEADDSDPDFASIPDLETLEFSPRHVAAYDAETAVELDDLEEDDGEEEGDDFEGNVVLFKMCCKGEG